MDIEKFWKTALKINLPVTLAVFIVYKIIQPIISNDDFIKNNSTLVFILGIVVINFAIILVVFQKNKATKIVISRNEIISNEVNGKLNIKGDEIVDNKIKNNKVKKDLIIGDNNE